MTPCKATFPCVSMRLLLIYVIPRCIASTREESVVSTTLGLIRGVKADDGEYFMYMGIPYAQVNRTNPFGPAIPQQPFDDEVFDANDDSALCPQVEEFNKTIDGSLDCLHINIYAPITASPSDPKPVMFMIYGGSFNIGFAGRFLYGPKYLVRHDVVYVTFNYRLGPYGFMCLDIPEVPGNGGLKDQVLALRWVKENIRAFGGDPSKVTAFGNSAGGRSVDFHLVSPLEKLFNQAILQSGSSIDSVTPKNLDAPMHLAAHLGFVTDDVYEALTFLAKVNERVLIEANSILGLTFGPCIEKQFDGIESLLLEDWTLALMPKVKDLPVLLGFTNNEWIARINGPPAFFENSLIENSLASRFNVTSPDFDQMVKLVHRFYMGDENVTVDKAFEAIDFLSDNTYNYGMYRTIEKYLRNDVGDIYFYIFSYVGERNFVRYKENITVGNAAHADEVGYLFDISYYGPPNAEDQLFLDRMTTLWTNFAKFGNPTPETSVILPVIWQPIKNESVYHYLDLASELTPGIRPFYTRMSFWDLFYATNAHNIRTPSRH